jgi:hypothetical protein
MARSCICRFTVASACSQRICWFIGHPVGHSFIWWFTAVFYGSQGAPAPADPKLHLKAYSRICFICIIVKSYESAVAILLVPSSICWPKVAFGDLSHISADSQLHLLIRRCSPLYLVVPYRIRRLTGLCRSTVSANFSVASTVSQLHLTCNCICDCRFIVASDDSELLLLMHSGMQHAAGSQVHAVVYI